MDIDPVTQQHAAGLTVGGAFLLLPDGLPEQCTFGIDLAAWSVKTSFRGVRMVPPGVHVVYAGLEQSSASPGLRSAIFLELKPGDIRILHWADGDELLQQIASTHISAPEASPWMDIIHTQSDVLAPFPVSSMMERWTGLFPQSIFSQIRPATGSPLDAALALCGLSEGSTILADDGHPYDLPPVSADPRRAAIPAFPRLDILSVVSASEQPFLRTLALQDRSPQVEGHIHELCGGNHALLLSQQALAFILLLVAPSSRALAHWRDAVGAWSACERLIASSPGKYADFLYLLSGQLAELPADLFEDPILNEAPSPGTSGGTQHNFLHRALSRALRSVDSHLRCWLRLQVMELHRGTATGAGDSLVPVPRAMLFLDPNLGQDTGPEGAELEAPTRLLMAFRQHYLHNAQTSAQQPAVLLAWRRLHAARVHLAKVATERLGFEAPPAPLFPADGGGLTPSADASPAIWLIPEPISDWPDSDSDAEEDSPRH